LRITATYVLTSVLCVIAFAGNAMAGDDLRLDCKMKSGIISSRMQTQRIGQTDVVEEEKVQTLALEQLGSPVREPSFTVKPTRDVNRKKRFTVNDY